MNLNGKQGVMSDHALAYSTWAHNRSTSGWCGGKGLKKDQKFFCQSAECRGKRIQLRSSCDAINLHSCFKRPRSWYSNIYAKNKDTYEIKTTVPVVAPHRCWLIAVEIYMYVVEIDLDGVRCTLSWKSRWWPNGNSSKTWNFGTPMSPYLIVVLISCISVVIDKLQCNQGIPRCNNFEAVRIMTFHKVHIMCLGFSTDA
jgi:hypothetical protein